MALNNRSAFESVPGKDALVEYQEKTYPVKSYVERNGLIFKSTSATSETFILSQWELVADLREVRVPDIAARNTLTGTTGTSYGVHTPILDNTNVLVLDASGDPEVGVPQFARYNYNQPGSSWLLLQVGTGATSAATSIEYSNVLNRPSVVSGVTINAGNGLSGGGSVFGSIPAAGGVINLAHADTSTQVNLTPTGRTYIQQLRLDTYGHVTGATQSTWTHPDTSSQANILNTGRTYVQSISVDGDGHIVNIASSPWVHPDTSTQANSVNVGTTFIQSIYLDGDGHVTGIGTGVAPSGGGGSPLTYNGDSGGALAMNSGSTLTISGGTNILTVRSGNAANPGLKINLNTPGALGQLLYNNGSNALTASSNLVFSAGTSTLRTNNYIIGAIPASGSTIDHFLTRNTVGGGVQRLGIGTIANSVLSSLTANNGLNKIGNTVRLGGVLTGSTTISGAFNLIFSNNSWTFGSRSGTTGTNSFTAGENNLASGLNSHAIGQQTKATNSYSHAEGFQTTASGIGSHAEGRHTTAGGNYSHAGGMGFDTTNRIFASGDQSFNHSLNDVSQTIGHGALATNSAILGGLNHNIEVGNSNAAIIGGTTIKLTGTSYINYTAVANLAIMSLPTVGINADDVLVRNATTGRIRRITQAALYTANNGIERVGNNLRFGGALTGNTTISGAFNLNFSNSSWTFGSRSGTTGTNSFTSGINNLASGNYSTATGEVTKAIGTNSHAQGQRTVAFGYGSHAGGYGVDPARSVYALGSTSFIHSLHDAGQIAGHGANANESAILGGRNHNIESGNIRAAIIGGSGIKLTGTSYIDYTAVANLAIMSAPIAGIFNDTVLVRNLTTGRVRTVTQANLVSANNGLTKLGNNNIKLGGALTGNTVVNGGFNIEFSNESWTFGSRSAGTVGSKSMTIGDSNIASGLRSFAAGAVAYATNQVSFAFGSRVIANGLTSFSGGYSLTTGKEILSNGLTSFNYSHNTAAQIIGHGALADNSVILGGIDHNIEIGNVRSAIIGGNGIKLTGSTYIDYTALSNLAIMTAPASGIVADNVLVRSSTTGRIRSVTQASLKTLPAGSTTQLQLNSGGVFGTDAGLYFTSNTLVAPNLAVIGNIEVTGQAYVIQGTLTDAGSIAWNLNSDPNATVTLGGNRALAAPTNMKAGGTYYLIVKQDGTGSRTLSFASVYKWSSGTAPILTTAANSVDIFTFICDGTNMYGVMTPNLL